MLPGVFASLAPILNHYGYLAVFGLIFLEDFGVPVPGETILIAAAVYAGAGSLNIFGVVAVGLVGAVLGDNVGYLIGRVAGRAAVLRLGKYVFLTEERLASAEAFFERHGGKVVVIARFVEGLRQANGIIAGLTRMQWARFVVFNAIGAVLWVGTWSTVGYYGGKHLTAIYHLLSKLGLAGAVIVVFGLIALVVTRHRRRRSKEHAVADGAPSAR